MASPMSTMLLSDRWFVVSTNKTDFVDDNLETLNRDVDVINTTIDQEIENRTNPLNAAAAKNNEQDERLNDIDARLELVAGNIGVLAPGLLQYFLNYSKLRHTVC